MGWRVIGYPEEGVQESGRNNDSENSNGVVSWIRHTLYQRTIITEQSILKNPEVCKH